MNKQMLEDLLKVEKHKNKILSILLTIFICLFIGMTIFAFSSFDMSYEDNYDYTIEQDADTSGDNSEINQTANISIGENSKYFVVGIAIIAFATIIIVGVILYGKSKTKNYDKKNEKNINKKT